MISCAGLNNNGDPDDQMVRHHPHVDADQAGLAGRGGRGGPRGV